MYTVVNIFLVENAACNVLVCFHQFTLCSIFCVPNVYLVVFLKEFNVPANTMSNGKLFQLFITLLVKKTCILISNNCLLV